MSRRSKQGGHGRPDVASRLVGALSLRRSYSPRLAVVAKSARPAGIAPAAVGAVAAPARGMAPVRASA